MDHFPNFQMFGLASRNRIFIYPTVTDVKPTSYLCPISDIHWKLCNLEKLCNLSEVFMEKI